MGCLVSTPKSSEGTPSSPPKDPTLQDRSLVPESDTLDIKIKAQPPPPRPPPVLRPTLPPPPPPPPPPPVEEETVKEVLSETPTPNPYLPSQRTEDHHHQQQQQQQQQQQRILRLPSFPRTLEDYKKKLYQFEEISEVSEISNLSEASVSTSACTERSRTDDFEVKQSVFDRSPAKIRGKRSVSGEFNNSPVRRREPIVAKSIPSRDMDQRRVVVRNSTTRRKDVGECSRRRSRSPAIAARSEIKNGVSRNMSARRTMASPGRIPVVGPANWETRESLEDPLVSLECFIFL